MLFMKIKVNEGIISKKKIAKAFLLSRSFKTLLFTKESHNGEGKKNNNSYFVLGTYIFINGCFGSLNSVLALTL